jgi:hypothetical protein
MNQPRYWKIEKHDSLVKDTKSGAILSTDQLSYNVAIQRKKGSNRVHDLEKEVVELKAMLATIISQGINN